MTTTLARIEVLSGEIKVTGSSRESQPEAPLAGDFDSMPAAFRHAQGEGATHMATIDHAPYVFWPDGRARRVYYMSGRYHLQARAEPVAMPTTAAALDYVAVMGKRIEGPFKSYDEAKKIAQAEGGYVQFAFEQRSISQHIHWKLEGREYLGLGQRTGDAYLIVPAGKVGRRIVFTLYLVPRHGRRQHLGGPSADHEALMHEADVVEADRALQKAGASAAEVAPVLHDAPRAALSVHANDSAPAADCMPRMRLQWYGDSEACLAAATKLGIIDNAGDVYRLVGVELGKEDQEVFLIVPLDVRKHLRGGVVELARGQRSQVHVGIADVLRAVIASGAESFVAVHNHPSGKCSPSEADEDLTKRVREALKPFGSEMTLVDHVIIGRGEFYSFTDGRIHKAPKAR